MPHWWPAVCLCTSNNAFFHVQRRSIEVGIKILLCHQNGNRALFLGMLWWGFQRKRVCLEFRWGCQRVSDTGQQPNWGQEGRGHRRRREASTLHDLHKPSHLSLGNNFSKCFSNGMVYTKTLTCGPDTPISTKEFVCFLMRDAKVTLLSWTHQEKSFHSRSHPRAPSASIS